MLNAKNVPGKGGLTKEVLDPGMYPGRLVQVVDIGLQEQRPYQGKEKPPANEFMLTYELSDEFLKDAEGNDMPDKPRWISETLVLHNLFADKAKSTARYRALDPDEIHGGDWSKLIGTPCNITIVVNPGTGKNVGKEFENVAGIATMRKKDADKLPPLVNEPKVFDLDEPDIEVFNSFPDYVKIKIKRNLNFKGSKLEALLPDTDKEVSPEATEQVEEGAVEASERPY